MSECSSAHPIVILISSVFSFQTVTDLLLIFFLISGLFSPSLQQSCVFFFGFFCQKEKELMTNGWIPEVWFLIWWLLHYELLYIQNWPMRFMRTENSWEKTVLHGFEYFPLFTWLWIQFEWRTLAFLLLDVARNWKHKDMQNENKLAKSFEAKNNLACRVKVLTKGSGSRAGKYLIWYGLNLSIDRVFWSFTIWALFQQGSERKKSCTYSIKFLPDWGSVGFVLCTRCILILWKLWLL